MAEKRILVVGSANIDFLLETPNVPESGETLVSSGKYSLAPGGKGGNAAVAAARLGGDVTFCTRVGDDAYGDRLKNIYRENGISMRFVTTDRDLQTGLAAVMLEEGGMNRIIVFSGANSAIKPLDISEAFSCYPDIVLTNCEIPEESVVALAKLCIEKSVPLVLDFGGANSMFPIGRLPHVEVISPNESETFALTGIRPDSLDDCLRACMKLCALIDCHYVVLKLGSRGSYVYNGKYCHICGPYEVSCVDTTAAGDAFTAAMTKYYVDNGDIIEACDFANAVGALAVTKKGALASLPTLDETNEFISCHKQI
ncbi:MAG: ribokinase [Clostridia bacterium]